jgi:transposase
MEKMRNNAAGIDIGARKVFVALENQNVQSYFTFTEDFERLRDYLLVNKVETVAMEATGVYWSILYEILSEAGIDVWLVDGRETKQVPGRKTDVKDCQWIQQLHGLGLLNRCFVAEGDIKKLKYFVRLREDHIRSSSMHINHMQKALIEMNIRLKEVISQIHGKSGMRIIESILAGERRKEVLLNMCHVSIKRKKAAEVLKALQGKYTITGIFALQQAYDGYQFYQKQIFQCDKQIEIIMKQIGGNSKDKDLKEKRKRIRHHKPDVSNLGANLVSVFEGKDATVIPGITDYTWMQIMAETGTNLQRWPTEKQFTSWLGLAPGQYWSGKTKRNRNKKGHPFAGQIFRQIAQSVINSKKIALGSFGRKIRSRKGPGKAVKAVARKLAVLYWRIMVKGLDYTEKGVKEYEEKLLIQKQKAVQRLALELDFHIIDNQGVII